MASSPVARSFTLGSTRRATELRKLDDHGFADVLAAKLPAGAVALLRKAKHPATIVLNADGAELKVGDRKFQLGLDAHESAHDCYRENVRSRRWEDLGPIRHSLQPTRKRARQMTTQIARVPSDSYNRAKALGGAARAMLGASGLADIDADSDSHDERKADSAPSGDAMPAWSSTADDTRYTNPRRGPGVARLDRAVSAVVAGGRSGRGHGRGRGRGKTMKEREANIIDAARAALQDRVADGHPIECGALSGVRAYNRAVTEFTTKHALQLQLDAELAAVATEYSMLSDKLAVAQAAARTEQAAEVGLIRSRMAAWERANANTVRNKLRMYGLVRKELLSLKDAIGKLADKQKEAEALRLRQTAEAPIALVGAPARGRARGRSRGRGRVGRPRGSRKVASSNSSADVSPCSSKPEGAEKARRDSSNAVVVAEEGLPAAAPSTAGVENYAAVEAARAGARGIAARMKAKKAERLAAAARGASATEPSATALLGAGDVALGPSAAQWGSIDMGFEVTE